MKVTKVSYEKYKRLVETMGQHCQFVHLPSTKKNFLFGGLIMSDSAIVPWPMTIDEDSTNGLTKEEMEKYIDTYGQPPDIFTPDYSERVAIRNRLRLQDE